MAEAEAARKEIERAKHRVQVKLTDARPAVEGPGVVARETFADLDGNLYELEYVLYAGGDLTRAVCRKRPDFGPASLNKGYSIHDSHLHADGTICLGMPNTLGFEEAVDRARFWANAYTFLIRYGLEETRRVVPDW